MPETRQPDTTEPGVTQVPGSPTHTAWMTFPVDDSDSAGEVSVVGPSGSRR